MSDASQRYLIQSTRNGMWHRRSIYDGHESATGYTYDLLHAGIFSAEYAAHFDDGENITIPLSTMRKRYELELALLDRDRASLVSTLEWIKAHEQT